MSRSHGVDAFIFLEKLALGVSWVILDFESTLNSCIVSYRIVQLSRRTYNEYRAYGVLLVYPTLVRRSPRIIMCMHKNPNAPRDGHKWKSLVSSARLTSNYWRRTKAHSRAIFVPKTKTKTTIALRSVSTKTRTITNEKKRKRKIWGKPYSNIVPTCRGTAMQT